MLGEEDSATVPFGPAPQGRYSCPAEIASLVAFLASEEAENIVGQIYVADGGEILH